MPLVARLLPGGPLAGHGIAIASVRLARGVRVGGVPGVPANSVSCDGGWAGLGRLTAWLRRVSDASFIGCHAALPDHRQYLSAGGWCVLRITAGEPNNDCAWIAYDIAYCTGQPMINPEILKYCRVP
jgi:hypothetical protein